MRLWRSGRRAFPDLCIAHTASSVSLTTCLILAVQCFDTHDADAAVGQPCMHTSQCFSKRLGSSFTAAGFMHLLVALANLHQCISCLHLMSPLPLVPSSSLQHCSLHRSAAQSAPLICRSAAFREKGISGLVMVAWWQSVMCGAEVSIETLEQRLHA